MFVLVLSLLVAMTGAAGPATDKSCSDLRQFYTGKGFTLAGVPQTETSGEHLRTCPQGPTCCTDTMEENMEGLSARETEALIREAGRSLQASFNTLYRSFDTYFTELHSRSERSLQEALSPLGPLYSQNTRLYGDLYSDLRQYYRGSALNLDETLTEFWSHLLERTFKSSTPRDVTLSEDYLECVAKQHETLRPFGDVPRDMKAKLIQAFVTARSFVQGLIISGEVVRKVSQVSLSPECVKALMKLVYCPHCRGLASVKPCANYCSNVMKGCLANQADLHPEWQNLIDTMIRVASSFSTEPSLDVVLSAVPAQIFEAVHILQENFDTYTAKVYQTCGTPGEPGTGSPPLHQPKKKKSGSLTASEYKPSPTAGLRLEMQVSDLSSKLREMRQYWLQLPAALCSKLAAGGANQDKCWNGMTKARYLPEVMGDGLASQINNPEVELDITKPDMTIRQQIMQLKIMSNRLKNALEGNDVDFQDASDDISGSGSGMCLSGQCPRSRPGLYAYPPDDNQVTGAAGCQSLLCNRLPLLPLAVLLLCR
ncbi:glypican-1-like [Nerophis lumbriciformis]|uniref:glypican-1-like n=1 Tax=Nerophis lumbriciformis TaxID=546530 RepID=UPI002ADFFDB5|nr:glypican-1-like [Nerophis lumbriciformis]XP_061831638.1 glypican-1-like [Nerophis lumbriciformis]